MKNPWKIIGYGLLFPFFWLIILFVLSLIFSTDNPMNFMAGNVFVALVLGAISYFFVKRIGATDMKEGLTYGVSWAAILLLIQLPITIPNQTTNIIFGTWTSYLLYAGIISGAVLKLRKA
ncbi:MAG: hypothetical protein M1355_02955 [Patescibacteria group bacterium]|nr:hypothetical protein [Patescibacteria group bacterium]